MENLRQVSFGEFNFANIVWSSKNKSTFYCCLSMNFSITTIKLLATSFWIIKILLWWDVSKHQIHFCVGVVKHCNCSVNGDSKHTTEIRKVNYFKIWVQYMVWDRQSPLQDWDTTTSIRISKIYRVVPFGLVG